MILSIIFLIFMFLYLLYFLCIAIKNKDYKSLINCFLVFLFNVFLFSKLLLGGSAFNDASTKYELYQNNHYYLCNHNVYTEVSFSSYVYMKIIEVVGISSIILNLIITYFFRKRKIEK